MAGKDSRLLLGALGIDNIGSGMFLPLTLVYVTRVVDVPLALAGGLISAGALIGLLVPLVAGRFVDALGPRNIVIAAQLIQLVGMVTYVMAAGPGMVLVAAALTICGSQLFYSALFTLVGDVAPSEPKDHFFAIVDMVRSACFGLGALLAGAMLAIGGDHALVVIVIVNAVSFLAGAAVGSFIATGTHRRTAASRSGTSSETTSPAGSDSARATVLRNGPFLFLTLGVAMVTFASDFFLVGLPVFALGRSGIPAWVPGACVTILTVITSVAMAWMVRRTQSLARTTVIGVGTVILAIWAMACMLTLILPAAWAPLWLIGATVVLAAGQLLIGTRPNALAESIAPTGAKGRYLSFFQFGFSLAGVLAPLLVGALAVSPWLPWVIVAAVALAGGTLILLLAPHLPRAAVSPSPSLAAPRKDEPTGAVATEN
jgi:MFS family permease